VSSAATTLAAIPELPGGTAHANAMSSFSAAIL
jgi:hypothetical protein